MSTRSVSSDSDCWIRFVSSRFWSAVRRRQAEEGSPPRPKQSVVANSRSSRLQNERGAGSPRFSTSSAGSHKCPPGGAGRGRLGAMPKDVRSIAIPLRAKRKATKTLQRSSCDRRCRHRPRSRCAPRAGGRASQGARDAAGCGGCSDPLGTRKWGRLPPPAMPRGTRRGSPDGMPGRRRSPSRESRSFRRRGSGCSAPPRSQNCCAG